MLKIIILISTILLTGCSTKSLNQIFIDESKKYGVNHKTIKAICTHESGLNGNVVNVNSSIFNIEKGSHFFNSAFAANFFMDYKLDPLLLNYDIGICQINKIHLDRLDMDNEELLDIETNINIAAKIYLWNVRECKGNIKCALSMYNTGKKHSKIGLNYANKVLKIRRKL